MHNLLLFDVDERQISMDVVDNIFRSVAGFQDVRHDTPMGTPIEADYVDGDDFTTVALDPKRETLSIRGTSGAALKAAWLIHNYLDISLRMVDTEYTFDLVLRDFSSLEDLTTAIENTQAE